MGEKLSLSPWIMGRGNGLDVKKKQVKTSRTRIQLPQGICPPQSGDGIHGLDTETYYLSGFHEYDGVDTFHLY